MENRVPSLDEYIAEHLANEQSAHDSLFESLGARDVAKILGIKDPSDLVVGLWVGVTNAMDEYDLEITDELTKGKEIKISGSTDSASPSKDKSVTIDIVGTDTNIKITRTAEKSTDSVDIAVDPENILIKEILETVSKTLKKFVNIMK